MKTQLDKQTNQNALKSTKLLSQRIRKRYSKTLGTSVINCSLSPLSLVFDSRGDGVRWNLKLNRQILTNHRTL